MPPQNPFALIVTPTCTNSQHMKKTTFSDLTNHPYNQCPSQKATSVSPSVTAEPIVLHQVHLLYYLKALLLIVY